MWQHHVLSAYLVIAYKKLVKSGRTRNRYRPVLYVSLLRIRPTCSDSTPVHLPAEACKFYKSLTADHWPVFDCLNVSEQFYPYWYTSHRYMKIKETLIKAFPAPDLRRKALNSCKFVWLCQRLQENADLIGASLNGKASCCPCGKRFYHVKTGFYLLLMYFLLKHFNMQRTSSLSELRARLPIHQIVLSCDFSRFLWNCLRRFRIRKYCKAGEWLSWSLYSHWSISSEIFLLYKIVTVIVRGTVINAPAPHAKKWFHLRLLSDSSAHFQEAVSHNGPPFFATSLNTVEIIFHPFHVQTVISLMFPVNTFLHYRLA